MKNYCIDESKTDNEIINYKKILLSLLKYMMISNMSNVSR